MHLKLNFKYLIIACKTCKNGYLLNSDGECSKIVCGDPGCNLCSSEFNCLECNSDYRITTGSRCVTSLCLPDNCDKCLDTDLNRCKTCNKGYSDNIDSEGKSHCIKNECTKKGCELCYSDGPCVECKKDIFYTLILNDCYTEDEVKYIIYIPTSICAVILLIILIVCCVKKKQADSVDSMETNPNNNLGN